MAPTHPGYLLGLGTLAPRRCRDSRSVWQLLQRGPSSWGPNCICWSKLLWGFCCWAKNWQVMVDHCGGTLVHDRPEKKRKSPQWNCTPGLDICILPIGSEVSHSENRTKSCQAQDPHKAQQLCTQGTCSVCVLCCNSYVHLEIKVS